MEMPSDKEFLHEKGIKNTKQRSMVLDVLKSSDSPVTAEYIYLKLKEENAEVWLSTIYRTLEVLTSKGLVAKTNILNEGKASYELTCEQHKHHMICMGCSKMVPVEDCPFDEFEKLLCKKTGFEVKGHKLEIYGYCPDCKMDKK
jgi:Fur family ferric uptake transcriptional regulator